MTQESPASGWPAPPHCLDASASQSHLICLGWISFSLLQARLSQTLGIQVITLEKNSSSWCSCDANQGCKTHHVPMAGMFHGTMPLHCCISHRPETDTSPSKGTWSRAKVQSKGIQLLAPFQGQEMEEALDSTRTLLSRWAGNHGLQYSLRTDYWLFLKSASHWVPWIRLSSSLSSSSLISCRRTSSPWLALGRRRPANWAQQLPGNSKQTPCLGCTSLLTISSDLVLLRPQTTA